jgi:phosphatidylglycerophosphate synthase
MISLVAYFDFVMATLSHRTRAEHARAGKRHAAADLAAGLVPLMAATAATWWLLELPASYVAAVAAAYAALTALLAWGLTRGPGGPASTGLGAANRMTLLRATLVLPVAALVLQAGALDAGARWWIIVMATVALVLDGVDGSVARRTGTSSSFGARFDMELDAFLILALSALVWRSGHAGPWVLLIGALRYLFVAAGLVWPPLTRELPPSRRRQTVCVVQGVALLVCLGPFVPPSVAVAVAATALAALVYSFGVDVRWLVAASGR